MIKVFQILQYLKNKDYININLDPSHILFEDNSKEIKLKLLSSFSGNRLYYQAPEILL